MINLFPIILNGESWIDFLQDEKQCIDRIGLWCSYIFNCVEASMAVYVHMSAGNHGG